MNDSMKDLNGAIALSDQSVQDIVDAPGNQQRRSPSRNQSQSESVTLEDFALHDLTKDKEGKSRVFPNGEFVSGGWGQ